MNVKWRHDTWNKILIRERYDLSWRGSRKFLTEETVPENYRDYFRKVTEFIIQCGEVLKAKEDGSLDQMTLEEGRTLNHKLYADVLPENYETSYTNPAYAVKTLGRSTAKLLPISMRRSAGISFTRLRDVFWIS